jgi:hypothetical protein
MNKTNSSDSIYMDCVDSSDSYDSFNSNDTNNIYDNPIDENESIFDNYIFVFNSITEQFEVLNLDGINQSYYFGS